MHSAQLYIYRVKHIKVGFKQQYVEKHKQKCVLGSDFQSKSFLCGSSASLTVPLSVFVSAGLSSGSLL